MYGLKDLSDYYTQDELANGCISALSEDVSFEVREKKREGEKIAVISAKIPTQADQTSYFYTEIQWNSLRNELIRSKCSCSDFGEDGYVCSHILALQAARLLRETGTEEIAKSPLKDKIVKKTGVDNPFLPGILKKTNSDLLRIIKRHSVKDYSMGKSGTPIAPGSLRLEVCMVYDSDRKIFELKVGEGTKHKYIVKELRDFLGAFRKHGKVNLGRNLGFYADEKLFSLECREILRFFIEMNQSAADGDSIYYGGSGTSGYARSIKVRGRYYDALMELLENKVFYDQAGNRLTFSTECYKPVLSMQKLDYGAQLSMQVLPVVTQTERWQYLRNGNRVCRVPREEAELFREFYNAFTRQENLFVSDRDLPDVCRNIIADYTRSGELVCEGMTLEQYLPPKPDVKLYLDLAQDDMISCKCEAVYDKKGYPLGMAFGQKENRDIGYEKSCLEAIAEYFHAYEEKENLYYYQGDDQKIYYFLTELLPVLEQYGELLISDNLKKLRIRPISRISVGISVDVGLLSMGLSSEEMDQGELVELLSQYRRKKTYYRLKDGSFFKLNDEQEEMFRAIYECVNGLRKPRDGEWKIPLFRALYLDEMLENRDCLSLDQSEEYRNLLQRMREVEHNEYEPPKILENILRNYQKEGFKWIKMLKECGFGGILADDMGLGKTLQVLAFLQGEKEEGKTGEQLKTLIITPASLIYNWKKEIELYTPELKVVMVSGTAAERQKLIMSKENDAEIWITSYDLVKRDIQWYEGVVFANEILDEAQYIKNQTTNAAKSVRLIQSGFRLALTGTPIENKLSELWSIFDYLMPGFLYSYARFREAIEIPVASNADGELMGRLRRMVHPFILRRLKSDVLKELPDKLEEEVSVALGGEQRKLYDAHAQRLKMFLEKQSKEEFTQGKLEILAELTKLRQLCCHPGMIFEDYKGENAKLETCMALLEQAISSGHKVLLFSQFTSMLDIIGERLKKEKIAYHRIDGSVKKEERMRLVEEFDSDDVPVFCISLKAGGTGLNLTAADIVIHYDPWWNLAAQNQATDRAHRIGQTNMVTVYQLIAAETIEERILKLQKSKYQLAEDVLSGEGISSILIDQNEVLSLLE